MFGKCLRNLITDLQAAYLQSSYDKFVFYKGEDSISNFNKSSY